MDSKWGGFMQHSFVFSNLMMQVSIDLFRSLYCLCWSLYCLCFNLFMLVFVLFMLVFVLFMFQFVYVGLCIVYVSICLCWSLHCLCCLEKHTITNNSESTMHDETRSNYAFLLGWFYFKRFWKNPFLQWMNICLKIIIIIITIIINSSYRNSRYNN